MVARSASVVGLLCVLSAFGPLGCSAVAVTGPLGCPAVAPVPGAAHPALVGDEAAVAEVEGICEPRGMPQVVARHVAPAGGVFAEAGESAVWVRFRTTEGTTPELGLDPTSLATLEDRDEGGFSQSPSCRLVDVKLAGGRQLVASCAGAGDERAASNLGFQGSAVGEPAVAFTDKGEGVLAFIESAGAGFQVVAMSVTCRETQDLGAPAEWARRGRHGEPPAPAPTWQASRAPRE